MLREGDVILIPADPYNVQGAPAGMGPGDGGAIINAQSSPADAPPVVDTTQQQIPSGKPYRIRKNDVLSRISLREYRTIKYAQVLFERNKAQLDIDKLELIRPGQVIYIPDRETIEHEYREFMAKDPTE